MQDGNTTVVIEEEEEEAEVFFSPREEVAVQEEEAEAEVFDSAREEVEENEGDATWLSPTLPSQHSNPPADSKAAAPSSDVPVAPSQLILDLDEAEEDEDAMAWLAMMTPQRRATMAPAARMAAVAEAMAKKQMQQQQPVEEAEKEEWREGEDVFGKDNLSPVEKRILSGCTPSKTNEGSSNAPSNAASSSSSSARFPRFSFFLKTPDGKQANNKVSAAEARRVTYAFKEDEEELNAWLNSATPQGRGGGLGAITESPEAPAEEVEEPAPLPAPVAAPAPAARRAAAKQDPVPSARLCCGRSSLRTDWA